MIDSFLLPQCLFFITLPYIATAPPSSSPPVSPSSLCCPGCFAPTEHAPSANATCPAQREPAGGEGWESSRRGRQGGVWEVEPALNQRSHSKRADVMLACIRGCGIKWTLQRCSQRDWERRGLTFLFNSWISAWVTACLIWSWKRTE